VQVAAAAEEIFLRLVDLVDLVAVEMAALVVQEPQIMELLALQIQAVAVAVAELEFPLMA
jgi:hypothetical protein